MNIRAVALSCKVNVLQPDSFLQLVQKIRVLEKFSAAGTGFASRTVSGGQRDIAGALELGPLRALRLEMLPVSSTWQLAHPGCASLRESSL